MMLTKLDLKNFKCFKNQEFNFSKLTVLCGANSSGKSTVIQSLLLIKQNQDNIPNKFIELYGELFSFGTLNDVFSHRATDDTIKISINGNDVELKVTTENRSEYEAKISSSSPKLIPSFDNDFVYLSAERHGPRASFDIDRDQSKLNFGIYGEYTLSEYQHFASSPVHNQAFAQEICKNLIGFEEAESTIYTDIAVKEAMEKICPGFDMKVTKTEEIDKVYNTYSPGKSTRPIRPINVGFGISYVLPIVVAGLCIKPGGTLIVENPEVHMHPQAQSAIAQFLGLLSKHKVQVIVETHSDHIINGLRIFAKENETLENHIIINSISAKSEERHLKEIEIDQDGNLTDLDEGFFDQLNKDLLRLF